MKVGIELQVSTEGVRNNHDQCPDAISSLYPLLNHPSAKDWQIVQKMPVSFENLPELAWHRKHDARIRNVRQRRLLLFQPVKRGTITTTRTKSRFAPVVTTLLFSVRGIHLPAQSWRATIENSGKILANRRASTRPIPNISVLLPRFVLAGFRRAFRFLL